MNKAILVGNLGRDAEMRYTPSGVAVASLSLATTERFTDRDGQKREDTQWHRVVVWGKTAEALQEYLVKGKQIYVEGKLQTRDWKTKEGHDMKTTEIRADRVVLLSSGGQSSPRTEHADRESYSAPPPPTAGPEPLAEEDLPF